MAKILVLAQGEYIADYALEIRKTLSHPEEMAVIVAHMEEAVRIARQQVGGDTEVIIARSMTANMIRNAKLPIPVVDIPISNDETLRSILRAQSLAGKGRPFGFLGFREAVSNVQPFLDLLDFHITIYDVASSRQVLQQIEKAKQDGLTVLVGGARSVGFIRDAGLEAVLIDTSLNSISMAYRQAREILKAVSIEKKKNRETTTILNSVSDAIISLDADGRLAMLNRLAAAIFSLNPASHPDIHYTALFGPPEQASIQRAFSSGEEAGGAVVEIHGVQYAFSVAPVIVDGSPEGAIVTLREILALQRMEATVRKGLYRRGNIAHYVFDDIKGGSTAIREAIDTARNFAGLQSSVLIIGETGTGKELFAQSIHNAGPRRDGPFVAVNCGAIPSNLIESELFGHEEGAFTGSKKGGRMGLFELAHKGTIFLDEISEMDQAGQVNLLRALQERQIRRVGGSSPIPVDVRVIAACNANLHDMVRDNRFRRDLYYRLSVLVMKLPPLRVRHGDVPEIAGYFIQQYNQEFGKDIILADSALREFDAFPWEGNIRQLRNFCERIAAVAPDGKVDGAFVQKLFRDSLWHDDDETTGVEDHIVIKGRIYSRKQIAEILRRHHGNREQAARELGISRTTLWKSIKAEFSQNSGGSPHEFRKGGNLIPGL